MNSIKSNTIHKGILFCMEIPHTKSAEIFHGIRNNFEKNA